MIMIKKWSLATSWWFNVLTKGKGMSFLEPEENHAILGEPPRGRPARFIWQYSGIKFVLTPIWELGCFLNNTIVLDYNGVSF